MTHTRECEGARRVSAFKKRQLYYYNTIGKYGKLILYKLNYEDDRANAIQCATMINASVCKSVHPCTCCTSKVHVVMFVLCVAKCVQARCIGKRYRVREETEANIGRTTKRTKRNENSYSCCVLYRKRPKRKKCGGKLQRVTTKRNCSTVRCCRI